STSQTVTLFPGGNPQPRSIAIADLQHNGTNEIVVANYNSNSVSILVRASGWAFHVSTNIPVGLNPCALLVRDLNRDGQLDIAVANYGSNSVDLLTNSGTGTFSSGGTIATGSHPL